MLFFTVANPGLEDINAKEIESLGGKYLETIHFINIFEAKDESTLARIAYKTQTSVRVLLLKAISKNYEKDPLEELKKIVNNAEFDELKSLSFAVRASKYNVNIDIMEIYNEIGEIIRKKSNAKVNLTNPDVYVRVYAFPDLLIVGYDLFWKDTLDKRYYRVYYHPAGLRSTIANSIIRLSEWTKDKILLDPLCGSGTIPIEAILYLREIPPLFRQDYKKFAMTKLFGLDKDFYEKINDKIRWNEKAKVMCFDKFIKHMRGTELNCIHARCNDTIRVAKINLEDIDFKLGERSIDYIITNPPYGIKAADKEESQKIHEYLFYQADYILREKGKVVLLTPHKDWAEEYAKKYNFNLTKERLIKSGGLDVYYLEFTR